MTRILSGTATVVAGDRTVAFDGPPLSDANCPEDGSVVLGGAAYFIASRTDTSHFELTRDYEGVTGTVSCEIDPLNANAINLVRVARSITDYNAKLALTDAYGRGLFYQIAGVTGANDPGPGKLARNAADWAEVTELYLDVLDAGGHGIAALLDLARGGTVYTVRAIDTGAYAAFLLSAPPADMGPGDWRKFVAVEYIDGDGIIADGELVAVEWNRAGADLKVDGDGTFVQRAAFDAAPAGFVYASTDGAGGLGGPTVLYRKKSATLGDWGSAIPFQGPPGPQGDKGWSPQLVRVSDGERRVMRLAGYVGGAGAAPTANVGQYLKPDGTFTANIADAADDRGPPGAGNGTVIGPPSSAVGRLAVFSDTTGQLLADGGMTIADIQPTGAVRFDVAQTLAAGEQSQALANIGGVSNKVDQTAQALLPADKIILGRNILQSWEEITRVASANAQAAVVNSLLGYERVRGDLLVHPSTNAISLDIQLSSDGGSTWVGVNHIILDHTGSTITAAVAATAVVRMNAGATISNLANLYTHVQFEIANLNEGTAISTTVMGRCTYYDGTNWHQTFFNSVIGSVGINAMRIIPSAGTIDIRKYRLEGVRP